MARSWLELMTGEIRARREADEWLASRREANRAVVAACLDRVVRPGLKAAAEARGWQYQESGGEDRPTCCRIVDNGPKPPCFEVSIHAVNPVAVLRAHPGGADGRPRTTAVRCDALDRATLDAWLN